MSDFTTKDSGARADLANGMVRDTEDSKPDYTLLLDGPMFERWCALLGRGAAKYGAHNWTKALASTDPEARAKTLARFRRSAFRHFMQWLHGDRDEDHAAAVIFNLNGYEAMLATEPKPVAVETPRAQRTVDPDDPATWDERDRRMLTLEAAKVRAELEVDRKVGPVSPRRELPL